MIKKILRPFTLAFKLNPRLFIATTLFFMIITSGTVYGLRELNIAAYLKPYISSEQDSPSEEKKAQSSQNSQPSSLKSSSPQSGTVAVNKAPAPAPTTANTQSTPAAQAKLQGSASVVQGGQPKAETPKVVKPTDASTGPRYNPTQTRAGGNLTGTYSGVRFTSGVTTSGPLYLTDCIIDGTLKVYDGPVVLDHCDVNSWTGIATDNMDPNKPVFTARFSKFTGPPDNDAMRIASKTKFGDNSHYTNVLFEDSIIHSPVTAIPAGGHLDVLQFGGGKNATFNRMVFSYAATGVLHGATQYINNGTKNPNVVFNYLWIDGGPMSYTIGGPVTINNCVIARTAKVYGYFYPNRGNTVTNCTDDTGKVLTSK